MSSDETKRAILARRARFIAAAVASVGIACGKTTAGDTGSPGPCLSIAYPLPDAAPPAPCLTAVPPSPDPPTDAGAPPAKKRTP